MDKTIEFSQVVDRCCGLDAHKKVIVATVEGIGIARETREFESTTRSLTELKEWLLELGVTHVAMESTGMYWKPVINILESGGFTLLVVNVQHIKYVPGQKTDKTDSEWICKLLRAGLLKGSFIPDRAQRDLLEVAEQQGTDPRCRGGMLYRAPQAHAEGNPPEHSGSRGGDCGTRGGDRPQE